MKYYACSVCGKQNAAKYGIKVEALKYGTHMTTELYLCGRCASRIVPVFTEAMDKADEEINKIRAERKEE